MPLPEDLTGFLAGAGIVIAAGLVFIAVIIGVPMAFNSVFHISLSPGSGEQIGYISEVSNSGVVWQPTAIDLINSEPTYGGAQTSWRYGSAGPEIDAAAREYLNRHEKVIVTYETRVLVFGWDFAECDIITGIKPASG